MLREPSHSEQFEPNKRSKKLSCVAPSSFGQTTVLLYRWTSRTKSFGGACSKLRTPITSDRRYPLYSTHMLRCSNTVLTGSGGGWLSCYVRVQPPRALHNRNERPSLSTRCPASTKQISVLPNLAGCLINPLDTLCRRRSATKYNEYSDGHGVIGGGGILWRPSYVQRKELYATGSS